MNVLDRVAGAPVSWGVCEVPGWGHQLAVSRVLSEMRAAGLVATEFGPEGFLPADPARKAEVLAQHGLRAVGEFVPVVLHDPAVDPVPVLDRALDGLVAAGADVVVLAAATGTVGYERRPVLSAPEWDRVLRALDALAARAADRGLTACLHPHVGTVVEGPEEVRRVLAGSTVPLCLDTGHLLVGGTDPAALAAEVPDRVRHVHLKDVDEGWAARVRSGEVGYAAAVRAGMYRPLGAGDVDLAGVVGGLEAAGYAGWYVLEQDTVLAADPGPGRGPAGDLAASLAHLAVLDGGR